jgi:hypothetical protein
MMIRYKATLLAGAMIAGLAAAAVAQPFPPHGHGGMQNGMMGDMRGRGPAPFGANIDPAQLPQFKGTIAQYLISPRGDVEALLLTDGTEIHVPPHAAGSIAFVAKPGDAVSIRGLKARNGTMVMAATITNDTTNATAGDIAAPAKIETTGKVKTLLHTPRGDVNGAVLEDGTALRLPPPEAERLAAQMAPGQTVIVKGDGITNPLGKLILVRQIGPSADKLSDIKMPGFGDRHGKPEHHARPLDAAPKP